MNPCRVDFQELYRRHLCRHSQYGLNVLHLLAVTGVYWALLGLVCLLPAGQYLAGAGIGLYLVVLSRNLPWKVFLATACFVAGLLALSLVAPPAPWWVYILGAVCAHRFQVLQHRYYDHSFEMSQFDVKYPKGPGLALLLAVYELPILMQFLLGQVERAEQ